MKQCYYHDLSDPKGFQRWITEKLAPVLLAAKPAEMLCFSGKDEEGKIRIRMIQEYINQVPCVNFRQFSMQNGRQKILFYHQRKMMEVLQDSRNLRFLNTQGYTEAKDMEDYLDMLVLKISTGKIPHEIGVFLGYPLKDVLGYMGHPSLKLTKVNGWKIYGNPSVSDRTYEAIEKAKHIIRQQLEMMEPDQVISQFC
ncbi:Protein of unknown function [Tindallia magadiensis]|uniref:DUF3793 family protein n=1 Tax=Tindallia magadiensis TaxID=69895 RepID=A0A1I3E455_9FIRM|nr:DUF3793 family protein [Tindallia magadiensis]SFH93583.1 Protein of unknown function [Tindallia magadiensis]